VKPSRCDAGSDPPSGGIDCQFEASGECAGIAGWPEGFEKTISIGALNSVT
jgi:hypothetical protein